jgi:hypothetical protein
MMILKDIGLEFIAVIPKVYKYVMLRQILFHYFKSHSNIIQKINH